MHAIVTKPPRASAWEWTQTGLLAANLIWTTTGRGGYPPQVMLVTSVLTAALVAVHFLARTVSRDGGSGRTGSQSPAETSFSPHPAGWLLTPFLIYAACNAAWVSPVPWLAWRDWFHWAQMIAVFWVVLNGIRSRAPQRVLFFTLTALALGGVALGCYQVFAQPQWQMFGGARPGSYVGRASGTFGMPNSLGAVFILMIPAVAALTFRRNARAAERVWWGWVGVVLLFGLILTIARGAWIALAIALIVWPLCVGRGRWWRRIGIALAVVVSLAAVGGLAFSKSRVVRARLEALAQDFGEKTRPIMWRAAWKLFQEQPVLGTGAASYNVLFEKHRPERFPDNTQWAHNDYLNTLSDYGVVGFVLFFGVAAAIAWRCVGPRDEKTRRRDWLDSPTFLGGVGIGLLAFALQLAVEFHFKIPALALAFATLSALAVSRRWPPTAAKSVAFAPASRAIAAVVALAAVSAGALAFVPRYRADELRNTARGRIDALGRAKTTGDAYRIELATARAEFERATRLEPGNGQAWADLSYAVSLGSHVERDRDAELGREAEAAAERALARSRVVAEFWIRRGVARDMQGRWAEAGRDFVEAVRLAPADAWAWYYYADHLSRVWAARESADAAAAFCLRLDPGNALALALRQRLAIRTKAP